VRELAVMAANLASLKLPGTGLTEDLGTLTRVGACRCLGSDRQ
jgi:hypothetical protein